MSQSGVKVCDFRNSTVEECNSNSWPGFNDASYTSVQPVRRSPPTALKSDEINHGTRHVQPLPPPPVSPYFPVLARAYQYLCCLGARIRVLTSLRAVKRIPNSCLTPRIVLPRCRRLDDAACSARVLNNTDCATRSYHIEKAADWEACCALCAADGPSPVLVPFGALLYGEKGYYTGTRVRASRYGIR